MARRINDFQTIHSEGGLLPSDLLRRVIDPKEALPGIRPEDYGLPQAERINEVVTQSWNRLRRHWTEFRAATANTAESDPATGVTNDKWTLPLLRELGFGLLPISAGPELGARTYAINRFVGPVPIHLVGRGVSLDRRAAGVRGAAALNPHGLLQEFLNRSPGHVWGIVSNGLRLRVLRDNQALSRQSYIEFDLEAMFAGEVYSDFVLLWLTVHATRFAPRDGVRAESCWLEQWTKLADEQGTRVLGELRGGVEKALETLGEGFTGHPKNAVLREALRTGQVQLADFHGQLLRVVYRLIFLFVAEDRMLDGRPILHPRDESESAQTARARFSAYYSTTRLRDLASTIKGSRHGDLWRQFQLLVGALSGDQAFAAVRDELALPVLGSLLWDPASTAALNAAELTNYDVLEALRHLAFTRQGKVLRPVDYRNLGAEELGGVYESLLALTPQISADGARFTFAEFAGNERKTSGSYYTPDSLVQCLLDSALDPVVDEAIKSKTGPEAEKAILALKVCDPAVGSGHFLVGAAHRLARHLARVRALAEGESEASPVLYQHALRDVIGRCLYGVDLRPMAAELCRVGLWLEALEPGKPLSFLDHHIRVGNSLLGTAPKLIAAGIPDEAFTPIEGDDKRACAVLKKRNKAERKGLGPLFGQEEAETQARLAHAAAALEMLPDDRPEDLRAKELAFRQHEMTEDFRKKKELSDTWCAGFVIRKYFEEAGRESSVQGITQGALNDLANDRRLPTELAREVNRVATEFLFFHWHLAFPEVFANGGFDCVLGNPPWEHTEFREKEWFAERRPEIANAATGAERKNMIEVLRKEDPECYLGFAQALRQHDAISHVLAHSGRYPLCGRGRINLYAVFAEDMRNLLNDKGRVGCVLPTGIATDDTTKFFFQDVVQRRSLVSLFSFFEIRLLFPATDSRNPFCLFTSGGGVRPVAKAAEFVFVAQSVADLDAPDRRFTLSAEDIALLNPNTHTCPVFQWRRDADLTKAIYRRVPVFMRDCPEENLWQITFKQGLFNMASDSHLFRTRERLEADDWRLTGNTFEKDGQEYWPLYEAKMIHHFDHRWATYEDREARDLSIADKENPKLLSLPRYWVPREEVVDLTQRFAQMKAFLAVRRFARATDERTIIGTLAPATAFGDSATLLMQTGHSERPDKVALCACLSSFPLEYCARQKVGAVMINQFILSQLPVLPPATFADRSVWSSDASVFDWILPRVMELTYTSWDMQPLAKECGLTSAPLRWDEARRFLLRCELDAAFFHAYLAADTNGNWRQAVSETTEDLALLKSSFPTPRDAVGYMMETFTLVREYDEKRYGDYRTKLQILAIYDRMQQAIATNTPYQTPLDPPPGDPRLAHNESSRPSSIEAGA
jgi:hypothetical protein